MDLKSKIAKVLSDILSDKYECKVTLAFTKGEKNEHGTRDSMAHYSNTRALVGNGSNH